MLVLIETTDVVLAVDSIPAIFAVTDEVIASLRATRGQEAQGLPTPADPPFRIATAEEDAALEPVWRPRRSVERDREQQTRT